MRARYIPVESVRIAGEYQGVLLIKRGRSRIAESGGRIPDGHTLDSLRELHDQRRLRFIYEPLTTRLVITEPSAPGRL